MKEISATVPAVITLFVIFICFMTWKDHKVAFAMLFSMTFIIGILMALYFFFQLMGFK